VIRSLAPDELIWFLAQSYAFLGHSDPQGFASRALHTMRDHEIEADKAFILLESGHPKAGVYVLAPEKDADDQNLFLSNLWYLHDPSDLERLLRQVFARHHYEALHFPLFNYSDRDITKIAASFERLGFKLETACDLDFELSELPPLGLPLVLEAWTYQADEGFQEVYRQAEAADPSDAHWAYLKRWRGPFRPDLWFIGRETLDQPPVGYAFYGTRHSSIDGVYYLTAAGVLPEYRHSSEMLRRLVLSSLHELASRSPLGRVETTLSTADSKLIQIFESMGFDTFNRYKRFIKQPL
jgi:hypothetical protein